MPWSWIQLSDELLQLWCSHVFTNEEVGRSRSYTFQTNSWVEYFSFTVLPDLVGLSFSDQSFSFVSSWISCTCSLLISRQLCSVRLGNMIKWIDPPICMWSGHLNWRSCTSYQKLPLSSLCHYNQKIPHEHRKIMLYFNSDSFNHRFYLIVNLLSRTIWRMAPHN